MVQWVNCNLGSDLQKLHKAGCDNARVCNPSNADGLWRQGDPGGLWDRHSVYTVVSRSPCLQQCGRQGPVPKIILCPSHAYRDMHISSKHEHMHSNT